MPDNHLESFLLHAQDQLVERWVRVIRRENPLLADLPHALVADAMSLFVEQVARSLGDEDMPWDSRIARSHGEHRQGIAVGLQGLIAEYGHFLAVVHELAVERGQPLTAEQTVELSQRVLVGAASSAHAYAVYNHREQRRRDAEDFAFLAHDLRNPLAVIQMAWQLLERKGQLPEDETVRIIGRALRGMVERLESSLEQMRARVDAEGAALRTRICPVEVLVGVAVDDVLLAAKGKKIEVVVSPAPAAWVDVDDSLLCAALINVLHNAVKHSPAGSTVKVGWRAVDGTVCISISDQGPGIDPDIAEHIYEAFEAGVDAAAGFGLGLAIVHKAVVGHGGSIHMENRRPPETGCRFTLMIPAAPHEPGAPGADGGGAG